VPVRTARKEELDMTSPRAFPSLHCGSTFHTLQGDGDTDRDQEIGPKSLRGEAYDTDPTALAARAETLVTALEGVLLAVA